MENVGAGSRSSLEESDLTDPVVHAISRTDAAWARMRSQAPVTWKPTSRGPKGFWVVTRHRDMLHALRFADIYASVDGNVVDTITTDGDSSSGVMSLVSDGERHRAASKVVGRDVFHWAVTEIPSVMRSALKNATSTYGICAP